MNTRPKAYAPWYDRIPKSVLYTVARQMGATLAGSCDDLDAGDLAIIDEWAAQYQAGNVPQRPKVKVTR
jgi:hypothetical protein